MIIECIFIKIFEMKYLFIFGMAALAAIVSCKPKKTVSSSSSTTVSTTPTTTTVTKTETKTTETPGGAAENKDLAYAQNRWPGTTADMLKNGESLYYTKCNRCHGLNEPTDFSEQRWNHVMDEMAPKANLTDAQRDEVFKYLIARKNVLEAEKKK